METVVSQYPQSSSTFIGRNFPPGSNVTNEVTDQEAERFGEEVGYVPLPEAARGEPVQMGGELYYPAYRIAVRRDVTPRPNGIPKGRARPVGIFALQQQAGRSLGDTVPSLFAALAENVTISYSMISESQQKLLEGNLPDEGPIQQVGREKSATHRSLNSPDIITWHPRGKPSEQSAVQLLLKSASDSLLNQPETGNKTAEPRSLSEGGK